MFYRIEITNQQDFLISSAEYKDKKDFNMHYNKVLRNINHRYKLHGCTMRVYQGINAENLQELKKYKVEF